MIKIRNPNGYGSIYKLSGNRRNPYAVSVTIGKEYLPEQDEYRYKRKIIGYFPNQKSARAFLAEYNKRGIDPNSLDLTLADVWKKASEQKYKTIKESRQIAYDSAFGYLNNLHKTTFRSLKTAMLQEVIDCCPSGYAVKLNMKSLLNICFEYALENDICDKNYAKFIKVQKEDSKVDRVVISERVSACEFATKEPFCDITLILVYSGLRISELLKNTSDNFDRDNMTFTVPKELAKNKSSARTIPVHDAIKEPLERFFARTDRPTYGQAYHWMIGKGFNPHSTRVTFTTKCHECGVNELTLKKILGHSPDGITEKTYIKISLEEMRSELLKVNY